MELLKLNELTKKKLDDTYIVVYAIKNEKYLFSTPIPALKG